MSSQSSQQTHEPTMEEILASIRKIISEDQAEPAPPPAAVAPAARAAAVAPVAVVEPVSEEPAEEDDGEEIEILELTVEVAEEAPQAQAAEPQAVPEAVAEYAAGSEGEGDAMAYDADAQTQEAVETEMSSSGLISDSTRQAMNKAFQPLEAAAEAAAPEFTAIDGSKLEAMFAGAINQAVTPAVQDWVGKNSGNMVQHMKPIIREWMDQNLPPLIEKAVKAEIAAAVRSLMQRR